MPRDVHGINDLPAFDDFHFRSDFLFAAAHAELLARACRGINRHAFAARAHQQIGAGLIGLL